MVRQILHVRAKRSERSFYRRDGLDVISVGEELFGGRHHLKRGTEGGLYGLGRATLARLKLRVGKRPHIYPR